jgi:hypothetical protein
MRKILIAMVMLILSLSVQAQTMAGRTPFFGNLASKIARAEVIVFIGVAGAAYLATHPEKVENYLRKHPDRIDIVNEELDKAVSKLDQNHPGLAQKTQLYENKLGIDDAAAQDALLRLESSPTWQRTYQEVQDDLAASDRDYPAPDCQVNATYRGLLMKPRQFDESANQLLPAISNGRPVRPMDVNTYWNLGKLAVVGDKLEHDHIPSWAAVELFLKNKGIAYSKDAYNNATAMEVFEDLHRNGRTHLAKNKTIREGDALDLRIATFKDLATHLYSLSIGNYPQGSIAHFLQSAIVVYQRNRALCLYD